MNVFIALKGILFFFSPERALVMYYILPDYVLDLASLIMHTIPVTFYQFDYV